MVHRDDDFELDPNEVSGIVLVNAHEALNLFQEEKGSINGLVLFLDHGRICQEKREILFSDFLVNAHETAYSKYGKVLEKIVELTK